MVLRLEEIRNPRPGGERLNGHEKLSVDVNYVAAFLDFGIDIESLDPAVAAPLFAPIDPARADGRTRSLDRQAGVGGRRTKRAGNG